MVSVLSGLSEKNVRETCCTDVKTSKDRGLRVGTMTAVKSQGVKLLDKNNFIKWLQRVGQTRGKKDGNETVHYIRVSVLSGNP